jgi:hypothetical protein
MEDDDVFPCQGCNGGGQVACAWCKKETNQLQLVADCGKCDGSGYRTCQQCKGTGEERLPW